jgi:hypothetical protein
MRPIPTHCNTDTDETQTPISPVGIEPSISEFERENMRRCCYCNPLSKEIVTVYKFGNMTR